MKLKEYGFELVNKGYDIVPIKPGKKYPTDKGWPEFKADEHQVKQWLANGHAKSGVGIITGKTVGVDLDISDNEITDEMLAFAGGSHIRTGRAPRCLVPFKSDKPFRKLTSNKYEDFLGRTHQVEILGKGQQFVAYAVHPDTGKDYTWDHELCEQADLPELTLEKAQAIIDKFHEIAEREEWELVIKGSVSGEIVDSFEAYKPSLKLKKDQIKQVMHDLPVYNEYDLWLKVGMCLYHQFEGSSEGLALWDVYSEQCTDYDSEEIIKKWPTLAGQGVTFATLIKLAREENKEKKKLALKSAVEKIKNYTDQYDLIQDLPTLYKGFELTDREQLAQVAKKHYKSISGINLGIGHFRVTTQNKDKWYEGWCYISIDDVFFHLGDHRTITGRAFNNLYGCKVDDVQPTSFVLDNELIPKADRFMYAPKAGTRFIYEGIRCVNTFKETDIEPVKGDVSLLERHFKIMFPDNRERELVLSFLAYNVQNPGDKINWALIIQGEPGDGKSFIYDMMKQVMGIANVKPLNAKTMESQFNSWAEGRIMSFIEEIKLHGHNRYDIVNSLKPLITNQVIEVHKKGKSPYDAPNTVNYVFFTNYVDAIPIDNNDRRFMALQVASMGENFSQMYDLLAENPEAIKHWLLNYKLHKDFMPKGHAPTTEFKNNIIELSRSSIDLAIEDLILNDDYPHATEYFINLTDMVEDLRHEGSSNSIAKVLGNLGWELKMRTMVLGKRRRIYYPNKRNMKNKKVKLKEIEKIFQEYKANYKEDGF